MERLYILGLVAWLAASYAVADQPNAGDDANARVVLGLYDTNSINGASYYIYANGRPIGTLNQRRYIELQASPGRHEFLVYAKHNNGNLGSIHAQFDLQLEPGATARIACKEPKGFYLGGRDSGPVLRQSDQACRNSGLTLVDGIGTCIAPYDDKSRGFNKRVKKALPAASCNIDTAAEFPDNFKRVNATSTLITTADFQFEHANKANTLAAYTNFLEQYPHSKHVSVAKQRLKSFNRNSEIQQWDSKLNDTIRRDARLPLQVRKDKYMVSVTSLLTDKKYSESLFYFELLDRLNVNLSPSFSYFWAEALLHSDQPKSALNKAYTYIEIAGTSGAHYTKALELSNLAEQRIATPAVESDKTTNTSGKGVLGVILTDHKDRAEVAFSIDGTPAGDADLRHGDRIISIDNERIKTSKALQSAIASKGAGRNIVLTIQRAGEEMQIPVVLALL